MKSFWQVSTLMRQVGHWSLAWSQGTMQPLQNKWPQFKMVGCVQSSKHITHWTVLDCVLVFICDSSWCSSCCILFSKAIMCWPMWWPNWWSCWSKYSFNSSNDSKAFPWRYLRFLDAIWNKDCTATSFTMSHLLIGTVQGMGSSWMIRIIYLSLNGGCTTGAVFSGFG